MSASTAEMETVNCNLCGVADDRTLFEARDPYGDAGAIYRVVQCRRCGLAYLSPRISEREIGRFYPADFYLPKQTVGRSGMLARLEQVYQNHLFRHEMALALSCARHLGFAPTSVLDVGCGPGQRLLLYRERGIDVAGLEVSTDADYARDRFGLEVFRGTLAEYLGARGGRTFDLVTCYHVLEHLYDPARSLREIRRLLSGRGLLVLVAPNAGSIQANLFRGRWGGNDVPRHVYFFAPPTIRRMLEEAGYEVKGISTRCSFLHPPTLVVSLFPWLDPRLTWKGELRGRRLSSMARRGLWAAATLGLAPLAWLEGLAGRGALLTAWAVRRPSE